MENPTNTNPSAPKPNIILITVDRYHKLQHYIQFVNETALASSSTDFAERSLIARVGAF